MIDRDAALQFLRLAYQPDEWVAVFLKSHKTGRTAQRVAPVSVGMSAPFQAWLARENHAALNVYVSVNVISPRKVSRRRTAISAIRHVYAFDAVYQHRHEPVSPHVWDYFGNLDGYATSERLCDHDADQRHQAVLSQIALRRDRLRPAEAWERPGNIAHCLRTAIRDEGVDSERLDHLLAPYWVTLWRLAARGHWLRHRQPVRPTGATEEGVWRRISVPSPITAGDLTVSFAPSGDTEFTTQIDFGSARRFSYQIGQYPELTEWRAMLDAASDQSWNGRYCVSAVSNDHAQRTRTLWLTQREVSIDFSDREWTALRDLIRQVC